MLSIKFCGWPMVPKLGSKESMAKYKVNLVESKITKLNEWLIQICIFSANSNYLFINSIVLSPLVKYLLYCDFVKQGWRSCPAGPA